MEEIENQDFDDYELNYPPKLSFEEMNLHLRNTQYHILKSRPEFLKTLYYYSKDKKKHTRIIQHHFWSLIIPFIQEKDKKLKFYGIKLLNQLAQNEGSHALILQQVSNRAKSGKNPMIRIFTNMMTLKKKRITQNEKEQYESYVQLIKDMKGMSVNDVLKERMNVVLIIIRIIMAAGSTTILNESVKLIRHLASSKKVIEILYEKKTLQEIIDKKILEKSDPFTQCLFLETISIACSYINFRKSFLEPELLNIIFQQIKSISAEVTLQALKIIKKLSYDRENQEKLYEHEIIPQLTYVFKWLHYKTADDTVKRDGQDKKSQKMNIHINIYRQISETFMNILQFHENHNRILKEEGERGHSEIIDCIVQMGRRIDDSMTTLYWAKSLAHITEILECHKLVSSDEAIELMIDILKDSSNLDHHREGCRFFANLSFQKEYRENLMNRDIAVYLLKAIDGSKDKDTIKHSAIALANLSSLKDFMRHAVTNSPSEFDIDNAESFKHQVSFNARKSQVRPLIHLLDSNDESNLNLIQSGCITLWNMASKPSLHIFFINEPEISTIKNCLVHPINKDLTRFMIKLVCNLTKNTKILPYLVKKGFLEILFQLLYQREEKEIFGNVVTAISYMWVQKECRDQIIARNILAPKILNPLVLAHDVDQKLIVIALTQMLFNGAELQREFIKHKGLGKLLFFMQNKNEKIFQQLACKCFSLLSEKQENLQEILDKECLNTIIVSSWLKKKEIDLETYKEIIKIFINLILWCKLKPDMIETTWCICDIGLMINDRDMNVLSMFCLNALSEDTQSHFQFRKSSYLQDDNTGMKRDNNLLNDHKTGNMFRDPSAKRDSTSSKDSKVNNNSIFNRINYLLMNCKQKSTQSDNGVDQSQRETDMDNLLWTLICSLYLNLSRNPENIQDLVSLKLFEKLSELTHIFNDSWFLYTTSIFSNLLAVESTHQAFMNEKGYRFFFEILKNKEKHQHLFLETLDSIKLLLAKREYLPVFKEIINKDLFKTTSAKIEYDLSNLQVLAILSFDQREHILKESSIIENIESKLISMSRNGWFDQKNLSALDNSMQRRKPRKSILADTNDVSGSRLNVPDWNSTELKDSEKKEFILALSIIVSNLSRDEKYASKLLDENSKDPDDDDHLILNNYNDTFLPRFLNLLEHDQDYPYISEQIAILLANLSNSDNFKCFIISDKCIKAMMNIINLRKDHNPTMISILAVLITILKLSMNATICSSLHKAKIMKYLLKIIKMEDSSSNIILVTKSIVLLIVSNIITLRNYNNIDQEYIDFAKDVLTNIAEYSKNEEIIISNNMLYSALILFYNLIESNKSIKLVKELWEILGDDILDSTHKQIVDILLELITLFTRYQDSCSYVLTNEKLINFVFDKMTSKDPETLELCTLALSRISAELQNSESKNLKPNEESKGDEDDKEEDLFKHEEKLELFIKYIKLFTKYSQIIEVIKKQEVDTRDGILIYYLNFLENSTALEKVRDSIQNMTNLYKSMLAIFKEKVSHENCLSIINILFNISLTLKSAIEFDQGSLKKLCELYKATGDFQLDDKIKKKIIIFVVAATSKESNHKKIIELGFYTQFKHNLNRKQKDVIKDEDLEENKSTQDQIELFGVVNLALNSNNFKLIHSDMKHIHTLACKNENIDFKTRVDLFQEISKFFNFLYAEEKSSKNIGDLRNGSGANEKEITTNLIKALIYTMKKLIESLDIKNFLEVKYLLTAFFECSQSLRSPYLRVLIQVKDYIRFLLRILKGELEFEQRVFSYSLKVIASEIIFNLKDEKELFNVEEIKDIFRYLIKFASEVLQMGIEANMKIVIHALRLISQLVAVIFCDQTDPSEKCEIDRIISFVKEAIYLNKAIPASVNIDALFTLTNLMNIEQFALDKSLNNADTVGNAIVIFFIFTNQVELDECIVSFLYTISHYKEYLVFIQDIKMNVIFHLLEKHLKTYEGNSSIIKKLFSIIYNLTAEDEVCKIKYVDSETIIKHTITMLSIKTTSDESSIHEIALKSLINICKHNIESLEEMDLMDLFTNINKVFDDLSFLSQQYSFRFITILINQWNDKKIEEYLSEISKLIAKFISKWTINSAKNKQLSGGVKEMNYLSIIIEKISQNNQLIQQIAEGNKELISSISEFISVHHKDPQYEFFIETFLIFINKLSKFPSSIQNLIDAKIPEVGLNYISQSKEFKIDEIDSIEDLIQKLSSIQNVMKVIKNCYERNIKDSDKKAIQEMVKNHGEMINISDHLLQKYSDHDDIAIIVVNIIIWFNSINKQLKPARVKTWIENFTNRLIKCPNSKEIDKRYKMWYMEKYVFILELLVTKNIDKIEKDITLKLTEITKLDKTYFNRTTWYKIVKILAHLRYLSILFSDKEIFKNIFVFILSACKIAKENLCFYYIMKILSQMKKIEMHSIMKSCNLTKEYSEFFDIWTEFLKNNYQEKNDPLILEILLYVIDYFDYLLKYTDLHDILNDNNVIYTIASMLNIHDNKYILKSVSVVLANASKCVIFNADLLTDNRMESVVKNILLSGDDQERCNNLFETCLSIISNTKIPVKFMIASSILRLTDPKLRIITKDLNRDWVLQLIQVLTYILNNLDSKMYTNVKQKELSRKTHKYCLIAMTNIMIRYDPQLIFDPKIVQGNGDLKLIMTGASFESDPQIHLRILYILYNVEDIKPSSAETSEIIIDFLMNIYNFRYVLTMEEPYEYPINNYEALNYVSKDGNSLLSAQKKRRDEAEEGSLASKPVPLRNSDKKLDRFQRKGSDSSINRDTNEEEESKLNSDMFYHEANPFYFENDEFSLCKIDGLRMSLCMSITILSRLSSVNRRANCTQILNAKFDKFEALFDYFYPLTNLNTNKCNKHVISVLDIILRGAEIGKLEDVILRKDTVKHLMNLLKIVLDQNNNEMVKTILKIFLHLSSEIRFHNDLLIQDPVSLLNSSKLRDNVDSEIKSIANDLFENVIKSNSQKYSYIMQYDLEELKSLSEAATDKQISFLRNFEEALQQNKVKLDQLSDQDVDRLIEICNFDNYNPDMDLEESFDKSSFDKSDIKETNDKNISSINPEEMSILQQKMIIALSIMKFLAKSKTDKIKRKIYAFIKKQIDTHMKLQSISNDHRHVIFEFYLEFYKNAYDIVKESELVLTNMFKLTEYILAEKDASKKPFKSIIEFCQFIMKNHWTEDLLKNEITQWAKKLILGSSSDDENIRNSISSFIKMIYFDKMWINDQCLEFLKELLSSSEKDIHNLGLFCLFSISLYELNIAHLEKIDAIPLLVKKLESGKYEKRVYALKIIINFMEISNLVKELLRQNDFQLFDFLLYFTQSEMEEEQRLATRGLAKLPLSILVERNPRVLAPSKLEIPQSLMAYDSITQHINEDEQKTIHEDSSENSISKKDETNSVSSRSGDNISKKKIESHSAKSSNSSRSHDSNVDSEAKDEKEEAKNDNKSVSKESDSSDSDSQDSSSAKSATVISHRVNIVSFINALSSKIKVRNNYDALYSIFNILLQVNINNGPTNKEEEAKKETIPLDQKYWNDLSAKEFNMLLIDWNLINNVISLLVKSKEEDIIRISLKIIILVTFKVPMKDFMNLETNNHEKFWVMSCMSNDTDNYNYFHFQSFLGYILHRSKKENIDITTFMSIDVINQFVLKLWDDFKEDELLELNAKGNNSKKKMIIYKFFFVSYLISLLIKTLDVKWDRLDIDVRLGVKQLCYNFIDIWQSIRIGDMELSNSLKLLHNVEEKNNDKDERHNLKVELRSSIIGVIVSLWMKSLYIEIKSTQKDDDSTQNILDKRSAQLLYSDPKLEQLSALDKKICLLILNNLTKYEDVGEIIELTYKYLSCFFEDKSEDIKLEYTELLENSKVLVTQAVKHIAVYKSESALKFINLLIGASSKYKNKTEIDNALKNLMNNGRVINK